MRAPKLAGINVEKVFPSGAWEVSAMKGGYRVHRRYMGYPKSEAIHRFKQEMK